MSEQPTAPIRVSRALHIKLKARAAMLGRKLQEYATEVLEAGLKATTPKGGAR